MLFLRQRGLWIRDRGGRALAELAALGLGCLAYKLTVRGMLWMLGKGIAYLAGGGEERWQPLHTAAVTCLTGVRDAPGALAVVLLLLWVYARQERIWAANPHRRKADLMWAGAAVALPLALLLMVHLIPPLFVSIKAVGAALASA